MTTYVLTLKKWKADHVVHCSYGPIRWLNGNEQLQCDDFYEVTDETRYGTIGEPKAVLDGAKYWFAKRAQPGDMLVIGTWTLLGLAKERPFEVLAAGPG